VFVVRGHLEDLQSDAVVITTDQRFSVDGQWQAVHRSDDVTALQPLGWGSPQVRYGRSADGRPLWFLDVTLAAGENSQIIHLQNMTNRSPSNKARDAIRARQRQ